MTGPSPLLPLPEKPTELPAGLGAEERLKAAFVCVSDHVSLHAMAWPARDLKGKLVAPPAEHVLHELAHIYELVDEESLMASPKLADVYVTDELPPCNFCSKEARYDALIKVNGLTAGAYLCGDHYSELGSGTLGASGDTYLMLNAEVPEWVRDASNQLLAAQGREPLF